jgi:hypothetical protein
MFRWISRLIALGSLGVLFVVMTTAPAMAQHGSVKDASLDAVRVANDRYHSIHQAEAAGYLPLLKCFDLPGVGGMGQHLVNVDLLNDSVDAMNPEAFVYQIQSDGTLKLVAVEYIIPFSTAWPATGTAPVLFGQSFTPLPSLGLWALHAWLWQSNPSGIFANFNPTVPMCPPGTK